MSAEDLARWDARYGAGDGGPGAPEPFVQDALQQVSGAPGPRASEARSGAQPRGDGWDGSAGPGPHVLDVAGGLGRHALAAARLGLRATLLDISPAGLARARAAATAEGLPLETVAADLDAQDSLPPGPFDAIVVAWFLLPEAAWAEVTARLAPGGRLVYVQPTLQNQERHPHPSPRFCVTAGDLRARAEAAGLTTLVHEVGWDALDHHTERLVAVKAGEAA
ncbi:MAG: class I SAM-dependent methyltransferase [Deltaproteobacteria bacterium]|nr:class I SAM-dependent methyltransferase [Deltaproteobacteria bacterium]